MKINSVGDDFSYIVFTDGTQYTAADSEKCSSIHREAHIMVKCPTKGNLKTIPRRTLVQFRKTRIENVILRSFRWRFRCRQRRYRPLL